MLGEIEFSDEDDEKQGLIKKTGKKLPIIKNIIEEYIEKNLKMLKN